MARKKWQLNYWNLEHHSPMQCKATAFFINYHCGAVCSRAFRIASHPQLVFHFDRWSCWHPLQFVSLCKFAENLYYPRSSEKLPAKAFHFQRWKLKKESRRFQKKNHFSYSFILCVSSYSFPQHDFPAILSFFVK